MALQGFSHSKEIDCFQISQLMIYVYLTYRVRHMLTLTMMVMIRIMVIATMVTMMMKVVPVVCQMELLGLWASFQYLVLYEFVVKLCYCLFILYEFVVKLCYCLFILYEWMMSILVYV